MKNCVIYARYSSDRQTEQSIEGQLRFCYEFAARNDLNIVHEYIDRAMTGTNDNRKDFQQMLRPHTHACNNTAKDECIEIHGDIEREK